MANEKVYNMSFEKVFSQLIAKAVRKGHDKSEVVELVGWLTGYHKEEIAAAMEADITYGQFFLEAPSLNPRRKLIKGSVCGVNLEGIEDPLMQEIRYLDKLVDELAQGKSMDKIMR